MKLASQPPEIVQLRRSGAVVELGWGRSKRKLHTTGDCRQEASRVYHMAAAGRMPPEDLSRAIYALDKISSLIERADLEDRVAQLEAMLRGASR